MANATLTATVVRPVTTLSTEQNNQTLSLSSIVAYTEETEFTLDLGVVVDQAVNFGTISSAKVMAVRPDQNITVKFNGSATAFPISGSTDAKGWFLLSNPNGGITAMTVTTTVNTKIKFLILE